MNHESYIFWLFYFIHILLIIFKQRLFGALTGKEHISKLKVFGRCLIGPSFNSPVVDFTQKHKKSLYNALLKVDSNLFGQWPLKNQCVDVYVYVSDVWYLRAGSSSTEEVFPL